MASFNLQALFQDEKMQELARKIAQNAKFLEIVQLAQNQENFSLNDLLPHFSDLLTSLNDPEPSPLNEELQNIQNEILDSFDHLSDFEFSPIHLNDDDIKNMAERKDIQDSVLTLLAGEMGEDFYNLAYSAIHSSVQTIEITLFEFFQDKPHQGVNEEVLSNLKRVTLPATDCSICLGQNPDKIQLDCNHIFDSKCILEWFKYNNTCPLCRKVY